jgi:hypothetical protein
MSWLLLAVASFLTVFLMGLQSKNVMHSQYVAAFVTSVGIGVCNTIFIRFAVGDGMVMFFIFGILPASFGICCSIWVHDKWMRRRG